MLMLIGANEINFGAKSPSIKSHDWQISVHKMRGGGSDPLSLQCSISLWSRRKEPSISLPETGSGSLHGEE